MIQGIPPNSFAESGLPRFFRQFRQPSHIGLLRNRSEGGEAG
jgi:hypothetical protein